MKKILKQVVAIILVFTVIFSVSVFKKAEALTPKEPMSSSYKSSVYYQRLCSVELTGNQRNDIIAVAESQMGYYESNNTNDLDGSNGGSGTYGNCTEYGYWYGQTKITWCAVFISWCAAQADIPTSIIKKNASASPTGTNFGVSTKNFGEYTPQKGDIAYIKTTSGNHVGLVYKYDSNYIYTIEGNVGDGGTRVKEKLMKYSKSNGAYEYGGQSIVMYGIPNYTTTEPTTHSHSYVTTQTVAATCTTDGYYVYTCSCGDSFTEVYKKAFGHSFTTFERGTSIHPHYSVYSCICGEAQIDETKTNYYPQCEKCNPLSYNITYNANGGNITPATQTGKGTISISSDVPERFGYSFLGWSDNSGAAEANYLPGQTINLNSNLNLYAVWEQAKSAKDNGLIANTYDVKFQFPGQTFYFHYTPTETRAWMIEYFRVPEQVGYSTTGEGLGLYLYDSNGNLLAASRNEDIENDISYFLNAGEKYYIKIDSSENATGEIYVGMIKLRTYTVSYNANGGNDAPESQTKVQYTPLLLSYAVPAKYVTITYDANGGSVSPSSKTLKCEFINWNTAQNGSGTSYSPGESYTDNSNLTLYAQWKTLTAGELATPTRSGYTFDGWYTAANGGRKVTSSTVISNNTTVYAHWTENAPPTTKPVEVPTTKPTEPTTKPVEESTTKPSSVKDNIIKTPSTSKINYGETLILHADFTNIPADAKIEWSVEGEGVTIKPSEDGKTCAVTSTATGNVTVTAKYVDANGVEHVSEQEIESNASLWQKIVSFFKNLFGINRVIAQTIKFDR